MRQVAAGVLAGCVLSCAPPVPPVDTSGACRLTFADHGTVRVFAVTHRQRLDDALSYQHFEAAYRRHLADIVPCLSPARPNLIVFPEDAGLLAWFIGRQAMLARHASTTSEAFNSLYAQAFRQTDAYRERFDVSVARALTLALADRAWRAMERTFGGIAKETGAWVVTSANLPDADEVSQGPDLSFRDPDAQGPAYVAQGSQVFNQALVYGPDGARLAAVKKVYLTDPEERLLDLSNGRLDALEAVEVPFGKLGLAISRDAFYPPLVQRLDDLGATLLVQPEAFSGWSQEELPGDWLPDVINASGWSATQKYAGIRYSVAAMLTGNLLDATFDGQAWVTRKAQPSDTPRGFVASRPHGGYLEIGPWAFDEPDVSLPLAERQAAVRALGEQLSPGSGAKREGDMADGVIGADLEGPAPVAVAGTWSREVLPEPGEQRGVAAAYDGDGTLYVAFSAPGVVLLKSSDDGASFSSAALEAPGAAVQQRVALAAATGRVAVAWQESGAVRLALSGDRGTSFAISTVGAGWEPAVALRPDGVVVVAFTDFRDGPAGRVFLKCGAAAPVPADDTAFAAPRLRGAQAQPTLARARDGTLALAWLDYREGDWQVYARTGDVCVTGAGTRVSPDAEAEVLAADPRLAPFSDGFALGWDEIRDRRANRSLGLATFSAGGWKVVSDPTPDTVSRFRPVPIELGGALQWLAQDLAPRKSALARFTRPAESLPRWDQTGDAPNHLVRPAAAARPDGTRGVACFEDDRTGVFRVRCAPLEGTP